MNATLEGIEMINDNQNQQEEIGYIKRVLQNEATRKGAAAAVASVVIALVSEALWPSSS